MQYLVNSIVARDRQEIGLSVISGVGYPGTYDARGLTTYFILDWADKVPRVNDTLTHASNQSIAPTPAPSPFRGGDNRASPAPPQQQHFSPTNSPSETPRSRKRLGDIEVGLKQREQDLSPIRPQAGPSRDPGPSASSFDAQTIPQPPSPVPTEIDCEPEPRPRRSFLGLDRDPEPIISTIQVEDQPSTPKKQRLTPPVQGTTLPSTADAASLGGGLPLTPPQTTRRVPQSDELVHVSAVRSRKGKEREGALPVQMQDQVGTCSS